MTQEEHRPSTNKRVKLDTNETTLLVDLDAIKYGSYSDLMKDYATLAVCSVNRPPPPLHISSSMQQQQQHIQQEEQEEETGDETNKKKRKRNNTIIPPELDTRVPFDKGLMASQQRLEEHIQQCRSNPIQHTIYSLMKAQLIAPTYFDPMCPHEHRSQEEIIQRLKQRQGVYLRELDSTQADICLYQAGPFRVSKYRVRNFPACMNGINCFCNRGEIKCDPNNPHAKPFIGREFMFRDEYEIFIQTGTKSYEGVRQCVMCARYSLCLHVPQLRAKRSLASRGETVNWPIVAESNDSDPPLQSFRERMDVEGGYLSSCMLKPNPSVWEGFIDPITMVILSRMTIRAKEQQQQQQWVCYIDQDLLKYQPETREEPRTGEAMSNF